MQFGQELWHASYVNLHFLKKEPPQELTLKGESLLVNYFLKRGQEESTMSVLHVY